MATTFRCPCGQFFQVSPPSGGARVRCPKCQKVLQIGVPAASVAPRPKPAPPAPPVPPSGELPRALPLDQSRTAVPVPRSRPPRPLAGNQRLLVAGLGAGVFTLFAVVGVIFAFRSSDPTSASTSPVAQATQPTSPTQPKQTTPTVTKDKDRPPADKPADRPSDTPTDKKPNPPEPPPPGVKSESVTRFIEQLNQRRESAGLLPVTVDSTLSTGCQSHAEYLIRHASEPGVIEKPNSEDDQRTGYSQAGLDAARVALIAVADPNATLTQWVAAPNRRPLLLSPELERIGIGAASGGGQVVTVVDVQRGRTTLKPRIVVFPSDGMKDVPLAFPGREIPDPVPEAKGVPTGYPITVTFPHGSRFQKAQGVLRGPSGKELPAWFSAPGKPANPEYPNHQGPCLCLIGKSVLDSETTYTAEFQAEVNGKPWTQTVKFTTISQARPPQAQVKAVVQRINHYRRLAGLNAVSVDDSLTAACQAHAVYLSRNEERANLNANDEDASLPGFTKEGKNIAQRASIGMTAFDPPATIDSWAAMFHYRFPLLDPLCTRVGIGVTRSPRSWHLVLVNEQNGKGFSSPLLFPAPDQVDVPIYYSGGEGPPPVPDKERSAGFPISAQFPERSRVQDATAELYKVGETQSLAGYVTTPQKPLVNPGYQKNTIYFIPKAALQPNTRYEAHFKARVDGQMWEKKWTFRTQGDDLDSQRDLALLAVAELNRHRKALGLMPVTLQEDMSNGCLSHARYLSTNWGHPSLAGLGMHDEQTNLPGYSLEGKTAGKESVIAMGSPPVASIEAWINTFYHRIPLFEPDLASVGVGFAQGSNPRWYVVLITSSERCRERFVAYPPHGATDVAVKDNPITLTVYSRQSVSQASLKLFDATGAEVPVDLQLPDKLNLSGAEKNTVALIPRSPLKAGMRYTVKGKLQGGNRAWTISNAFQTSQ